MIAVVGSGQRELDLLITGMIGTPISPVTYREGVLKLANHHGAQLVVVSAFLPGNISNEDMLYELRKQGIRVIVLTGNTDLDTIRKKWLPLGVYDYVTDPVTEKKLQKALSQPATLGDAEEHLLRIERGEEDLANEGREQKHEQKIQIKKTVTPKLDIMATKRTEETEATSSYDSVLPPKRTTAEEARRTGGIGTKETSDTTKGKKGKTSFVNLFRQQVQRMQTRYASITKKIGDQRGEPVTLMKRRVRTVDEKRPLPEPVAKTGTSREPIRERGSSRDATSEIIISLDEIFTQKNR